jgi:hypothetical protein
MKITYKNKKPDAVKFKDIRVGQTFYDRDGQVCLKIDTNNLVFNAFSLSFNCAYEFNHNDLMFPVDAELIVEGEEAFEIDQFVLPGG